MNEALTASRAAKLAEAARNMPDTTVMEVCGTHTRAVARYALKQLLPKNMRLISGPGCPVCVTDDADIALAAALAGMPSTTLYSFGDMLRVPFSGTQSVPFGGTQSVPFGGTLRECGADIRVALSPMDALAAAKNEPERQIIWFAVGFETTAPLTAAMLMRARADNVKNLSVLSTHKTMPAALKGLLNGTSTTHALLCPGHVAVTTGADAFAFVPDELGLAAAVSGFEPEEILLSLTELAKMRACGHAELKNCYSAAVTKEGNTVARAVMNEVFMPADAVWRGLGEIAGSGLEIREEFATFDAKKRFYDVKNGLLGALRGFSGARKGFNIDAATRGVKQSGCACADILRGEMQPEQCRLFGCACTPDAPKGPCMVSMEGACAAAWEYGI